MIVKLLIFFCSVYIVNAYVAINIFDDEVDTKNSSVVIDKGLSDCIPLICWAVCRGVCANGVCICNKFLLMGDADSQATPRMDLDESPVISECSPLGCAQLCRRIGLKGGVCVHGKCKCDLFVDSAVPDTNEIQTPLAGCDWVRCNHGCRSIGYPGGRCVGSQCRCNPRSVKHRVENVDVPDTNEIQTPLGGCDWARCNRGCRSIGYPGGRCVGSQCRCNHWSVKHHVENLDGMNFVPDDTLTRGMCNWSQCFRKCQIYGNVGGFCWGDHCLCIPRSANTEENNLIDSLKDDVQDATETPLEKCHSSSCDLKCRKLGFVGGFCIAKRCICLPRSTEPEGSNLIISSDGDVQEMKLENPAPMLSDCNIVACEQLCRRIFMKGGSCVNGHCKCDIISDATESNEVPLTEYEDKDEETALDDDQKTLVGSCFTNQCILMCRRIGFRSGRCDYRGACICY